MSLCFVNLRKLVKSLKKDFFFNYSIKECFSETETTYDSLDITH